MKNKRSTHPPHAARLPGLLPILIAFTFLSVGVRFFNALYASHAVQKERALTHALDEALEAWSHGNSGGAILALDLDHFKRVNDTYGHAAGDRVLVEVSGLIRRSLRERDQPFRVGGEEFIVLLPGASQDASMDVAQRLRAAVAQTVIEGVGHVSISGGIALWTPGQCSAESALAWADEALYASKAQGRNRITRWAGAP